MLAQKPFAMTPIAYASWHPSMCCSVAFATCLITACHSAYLIPYLIASDLQADLHEFWSLFCGGIHCGKGDPALKGDATTGLLSGVEAMVRHLG